ncbi:TolB family protein [Nonomuraea sp. SYSU D8015]|uniref:TolB family protein n=1 Tax=Nonomuraea sp. SYSU D8015 TaxID=2593644 RepID=UPI0016611F2F|nr:hypothetical protein [Nonomuraea sp. SYSU D8015]
MNIEDLLRETLHDMAGDEEPPPPDRFLSRITTTSTRPSRLIPLVTAAAVVVLVVVSTLVIQQVLPRESRPPEPADRPAPAPAPVEKLWPGAVHSLPRALRNGLSFRPELFIDARTLLVRTGKGNSADPAVLWTYDVASGQARRLVAPTPPARTDYTSPVVTGSGRLVWYTVSWGKVKGALDIWAAPVGGGTAHKVTTIRQTMKYGDIDVLSVAGDKVVWSRSIEGGVYEAPLSGGKPRFVPSTERLHLLQWPWAARASRVEGDLSDSRPSFARLVNVLNGEERTASDRPRVCSLTWCVDRRSERARRRDGSGDHRLPAQAPLSVVPALDRFLLLRPRGRVGTEGRLYLHDLATRRTGDLGVRFENGTKASADIMNATYMDHRTVYLLTYPLKGRQMVINLTAIR